MPKKRGERNEKSFDLFVRRVFLMACGLTFEVQATLEPMLSDMLSAGSSWDCRSKYEKNFSLASLYSFADFKPLS